MDRKMNFDEESLKQRVKLLYKELESEDEKCKAAHKIQEMLLEKINMLKSLLKMVPSSNLVLQQQKQIVELQNKKQNFLTLQQSVDKIKQENNDLGEVLATEKSLYEVEMERIKQVIQSEIEAIHTASKNEIEVYASEMKLKISKLKEGKEILVECMISKINEMDGEIKQMKEKAYMEINHTREKIKFIEMENDVLRSELNNDDSVENNVIRGINGGNKKRALDCD